MAKRKPHQILIFAENLRKRIIATDFEGNNLESFLNAKHEEDDELILEGVKNFYRDRKSNVYLPKSQRNFQAIKCNQIDFVLALKNMRERVFAPTHVVKPKKVSVMYGLHNLNHDLIGDIIINENNYSEDERDQLLALTKVLKRKKFIQFQYPRQRRLQRGFTDLFKGTGLKDKGIDLILLNRTGYTINSKSIYLGPGIKESK